MTDGRALRQPVPPTPPPPGIDLLDGTFYADPARSHAAYTWLREHAPVHLDAGGQVWGVATYDAVLEASRDPARFSSAGGIRPDMGALAHMIDMDDPAHAKRRRLVSRGFTPRRVAEAEPALRRLCDELIDAVCERGECDLVADIAAPLPMAVIGDLLGVDKADRATLLRWSDDMVSSQGGNATPAQVTAATSAYVGYVTHARRVIAARRAEPTADLVSVLVHAEVDGERLTDDDVVAESLLVLIGGDETTRHVISGGVEQLLRRPDQWLALRAEPARVPVAVEEMLRWVSPIKNMCRTATTDLSWRGARILAGQKLLLLYESANFDDARFAEPAAFDAARTPNDHLAFGNGPHFCLGNSLARLETRVMLEQLLGRLPDLALAGGDALPRRPATFVSGLESMPVTFTPTRPMSSQEPA